MRESDGRADIDMRFFLRQVESALSIAERLLSIGEVCHSGKRVRDQNVSVRKESDDSDSE